MFYTRIVHQLDLLAGVAVTHTDSTLPPGAEYVSDFITLAEERRVVDILDANRWSLDLKRRVQHYGYRYDYKMRTISLADKLGPLPVWAMAIAKRLVERGHFDNMPDQVIVNEYLPGQGIASHIDRTTCFGAVVASLSLLDATIMDFTRDDSAVPVELLPRSLVVLRGDSRTLWRHGIASRRRDIVRGAIHERRRRISLTFRTVTSVSAEYPYTG